MKVALWWIRRDLRLADNQALHAALSRAGAVVPVFVLDESLWASPYVGEKRLAFLVAGLSDLDGALRARGSYLVVRHGQPVEEIIRLCRETGAEDVFAEADVSPYARKRDARVSESVPLHLIRGLTVFSPDAVLKNDGTPYTVFTPYSRRWQALPLPVMGDLLPPPDSISTPSGIATLSLPAAPALPSPLSFPAGEVEARRRLKHFVATAMCAYASDRERMDLEGTSKISPYLRFGMISAREAVIAALQAREEARLCDQAKGADTWLNELIWREFYLSILYHFPDVRKESFRANLQNIEWSNDEDDFQAWQEGQTGYPIVDAAMRQLKTTGWMHNRARMIVASFLTKDLLIDWRWGERHFMRHLVDGDPSANNGGWQWAAGTGADAAPYFRIFNPVLQGEKYDPEGAYVRRYVPELRALPARYIHRPWSMPEPFQKQAACVIGVDYPAPIVDHRWARQRTLEVYKRARDV
ncbi:MAG: deoxyribodipyrimidine photo-lyase [Anaerolineae bacterium]|nr:deoxyribodipyrimidine photo-lyase [Anaerolineae bacterium]